MAAANAQNTKGDKPAPANRDNRFKSPFRKGVPKRKPASDKRVRSRQQSVATRASTGSAARRASGKDRPSRPLRPLARTQPDSKQHAWRGDIAGYRIRAKSPASSSRKNVYPQYGRYGGGNPSRFPRPTENASSNREALAKLKRIQSPQSPPGKKRRVVPRSASSSYIARKSINVYANFARPKRRGERAVTTDLAGRALRKKNFESPRPSGVSPGLGISTRRPARGDRPYNGTMRSGYRSATKKRPTAWLGDIAGRNIRGRNFTSKKSIEGVPIPSMRPRSATRGHTGERPIDARVPGIGASGINGIKGGLRARRPLKGGGSVSGRLWNNNQRAIDVRTPEQGGRAALFQGNIKGRKPLKGGGSVSGRLWNNNQQPLVVDRPSQGAQAGYFQGNIKVGRTTKGMSNVQGSLPRKGLPSSARKVNGFPGKWHRFDVQPGFGYQGELERGNIKLKRFNKTYGQAPRSNEYSNKERLPKKSAFDVLGLAVKRKRPEYIENKNAADDALLKRKPSRNDIRAGDLQVKIKRPDYIENKNAADNALKKRRPSRADAEAGNLQVRVKRPDYIENKNSADDALLKLRPSRANAMAGNLQVKVKQAPYGKKPNAAEGSLPGIKPSKTSVKASEYARSVKRNWDYIHNPSSAEEALKVREPNKAFAKVAAYQGNIKMRKYEIFEKNRALHPDSKFVKTNKNNVDSERDVLTNFKLWWARLFKKEETQPEGLKYKGKRPRYDKGEAGMWYE